MPQRIVYLQYTNPGAYPPLEHSAQILSDNGWQILFLGTGALGSGELSLSVHPPVKVRKLRYQPPGLLQKLHYAVFVAWSFAWSLIWRPQWIYVSDPLACPPGLLLSSLLGVSVIYHEHDSPSSGQQSGASLFIRCVLLSRKILARRAAICVLPNAKRAQEFQSDTQTPRPVICVWNCPHSQDLPPLQSKPPHPKLTMFFHGSIVPSRLPLTVIEALALLPEEVELHVAGYETTGHRGHLSALRSAATQLGVDTRFRYHGAVPSRKRLLERCAEADVGLALMPMSGTDPNELAMAGASNKPFDYLACGLALLVSELPEWKTLFVEPGLGIACNPSDPESIARALRWYYDNPAARVAMGAKGRAKILQEWNYERQFAPVLRLMSQVKSSR